MWDPIRIIDNMFSDPQLNEGYFQLLRHGSQKELRLLLDTLKEAEKDPNLRKAIGADRDDNISYYWGDVMPG